MSHSLHTIFCCCCSSNIVDACTVMMVSHRHRSQCQLSVVAFFIHMLIISSFTNALSIQTPHRGFVSFGATTSTRISTSVYAGENDSMEPNGSSMNSSNRQALYGTTLEMPDTYVRCGKCQTAYAMTADDLGARGRRLECSVCTHSWFQTKDRLLTLTPEFSLSPLPERDLERIKSNLQEGKAAKYMGEKKLYVGNLAFQCHEDDLYEIFGKYGDVGEVNLIRDEDGRPRGFGFVTMRTDEGGDKAIAELDGMVIRGRNIAVRESNS